MAVYIPRAPGVSEAREFEGPIHAWWKERMAPKTIHRGRAIVLCSWVRASKIRKYIWGKGVGDRENRGRTDE